MISGRQCRRIDGLILEPTLESIEIILADEIALNRPCLDFDFGSTSKPDRDRAFIGSVLFLLIARRDFEIS